MKDSINLKRILAAIAGLALSLTLSAAKDGTTVPWDLEALSRPPRFVESPEHGTNGVKAIFYEALPWSGKPTRVFAYYGLPEVRAGETVPAMVLVHGGGGSAFIPWVQLWVKRGYAAISMDTCGCVSGGGYENHPRHADGGPPGWGGFGRIDEPATDQWTYHAVADVILAHSLIRSFARIDPERTGITGVSWGGYLTCIVAGLDPRFKFAAPVYGCGFLGDNSAWLGAFSKMGTANARRWLGLWDPSTYLPGAMMPMLWVTGSNDFAYPMDSLQKSYRLPGTSRTLCIRLRMKHGHGGPGENPKEIHAMAETVLRNGAPLPRVTGAGSEGKQVWVTCESAIPIVKAELNYTTDSGNWKKRLWKAVPAGLDPATGRTSAELPAETTVYYFNITDKRGLLVSSEHVEID